MSLTVTSFIPGIVAGAQPVRKADTLTFPLPGAPQAMSIYIRFVELGNVKIGAGVPRLFMIGATGSGLAPAPGFYVTYNGGYGIRYNNTTVNSPVSSVVASPLPAIGQTVEILCTLSSAGVCQMSQAINGGTIAVASASAAKVLPQAWASPTLTLGPPGAAANAAAIQNFLIVRGVQTLQTMRKYAGVV